MEIERSAPGKVILCGEHSVVYGFPAIAIPVSGVRTWVHIASRNDSTGLQISAPDIGQTIALKDAQEQPLALAARLVLETLVCSEPDAIMMINSQLPIAAGMGSGAAVTVGIIRAMSAFLGNELDNNTINRLTFEVEKIYHGSPSGIDNTVITWERPIYFIRGNPPNFCSIGAPVHVLIASSGIAASTRKAVNEVQARRSVNPHEYELIFNRIGDLANTAHKALAGGDLDTLGAVLNANHALLAEMGVSIPKLDTMVDTALQAGALGAKLTGSGQGGNMIALVDENHITPVKNALYKAGSAYVWQTLIPVQVGPSAMKTIQMDN